MSKKLLLLLLWNFRQTPTVSKYNSFVFFSFCDGKCFQGEFYPSLLVIPEVKSSSDFSFLSIGWWNVSKTSFQAVVFSNTSSAHKSHISIKHFQDCWPLEFLWCWWISLTIIQRFYISSSIFFSLIILNLEVLILCECITLDMRNRNRQLCAFPFPCKFWENERSFPF